MQRAGIFSIDLCSYAQFGGMKMCFTFPSSLRSGGYKRKYLLITNLPLSLSPDFCVCFSNLPNSLCLYNISPARNDDLLDNKDHRPIMKYLIIFQL